MYGFQGMYSGTLLVSTFVLIFALLENAEIYTRIQFGSQNCFLKFSIRCKKFRMFQIIVTIANSVLSNFLTLLIAVGVLAASLNTNVTITLWNRLRIILYMASPVLSFCCYMIAIFMTQYANIP